MVATVVPDAMGVTFNVDMSCAPEFDNVFVTGPWCGWCANDVYNTMTDDDGDGIYSVTVPDLTGTVDTSMRSTFRRPGTHLINDMVDWCHCAPVTDFAAQPTVKSMQVCGQRLLWNM